MGQVENVWRDIIEKNLHHLSSRAFENVCIYYLWKQSEKGKTPFSIIEAMRWWGKLTKKDATGKLVTTSEEIDIIATDVTKTNYILGECKFKNESFDLHQLIALREKTPVTGTVYYYLFSLNGFTEAVIQESRENDSIRLISLDDLFR